MPRLGKAHSLPDGFWEKWLDFVLEHEKGGPKLFACLWLTSAMCLRITQAAQLVAEEVLANKVYIRAFKGKKAFYKSMLPSVAQQIRKLRKEGLEVKSLARQCGGRGLVRLRRHFSWPKKGPLFASRTGASKGHWNKDVVAAKIRQIRPDCVAKHSRTWP